MLALPPSVLPFPMTGLAAVTPEDRALTPVLSTHMVSSARAEPRSALTPASFPEAMARTLHSSLASQLVFCLIDRQNLKSAYMPRFSWLLSKGKIEFTPFGAVPTLNLKPGGGNHLPVPFFLPCVVFHCITFCHLKHPQILLLSKMHGLSMGVLQVCLCQSSACPLGLQVHS